MKLNYSLMSVISCTLVVALAISLVAADVDPLDCGEDDYLIGVTPPTSKTRCQAQDKAALLAFKKGISSDPNAALSNWNASTDCCTWNGVTCDGTSSRVVSLNLGGRGLHGIISPGLSGLSYLQVLKLYDNVLTGHLPSSLGSLSKLLQFCASGNTLTGSIPDSYGTGLSSLLIVDVRSNQLNGPLPSTIGGMSSLQELHIYGNRLSGAIPASFGKLSNLFDADMGSNSFSGAIPDAFNDNLTSLAFLYLDRNQITAFPKNLSKLKNLQWVSLTYNPIKNADNLAGLATAPKLVQLELSNCQLTGTFPAWMISRFPHTDTTYISDEVTPSLDLAYNSLSGPIPTNIGSALPDYLERLYLNNNHFTGHIPSSLSKISSLRYFNVSYNHLSGQIPQVAPLNTFGASAYKGNSGLCGSPLTACKH